MALQHRKNVLLFGAPCVCKGFIGRLAQAHFGNRLTVVGTGNLVRKALGSPSFAAEFAKMVSERNLVPDDIIFHLTHKALLEVPTTSDVLLLDGLGRLPNQIDWAEAQGLLASKEGSLSFVFNATPSIIRTRWADRQTRNADGKRNDNALRDFENGLKIYLDNWPKVLARLRHTGTKIVQITANADIETSVWPDVLSHLNHLVNPVAVPPPQPRTFQPCHLPGFGGTLVQTA